MSHIWMCHVTHMNVSCHRYECVMSQIWMRHVAHMNASCHKFDSVMSHIWMRHVRHMNVSRHVTHMNASFNTYERVVSHIRMRRVTHINASCPSYQGVIPYLCLICHQTIPVFWMSHVTHMDASCHTYEWVMSHMWMGHVSLFMQYFWMRQYHVTYRTRIVYDRTRSIGHVFYMIEHILSANSAIVRGGGYALIYAILLNAYKVATISRIPKNIGLFCKRALKKRLYSAKETCIFKEPTNHSHPTRSWYAIKQGLYSKWVMSRICMRHVTHINGSCVTYDWIMLCVWMSRVARYEWVM